MQFVWDEAKRQINLLKHGIDFADVPAMFAGDVFTIEDDALIMVKHATSHWASCSFG